MKSSNQLSDDLLALLHNASPTGNYYDEFIRLKKEFGSTQIDTRFNCLTRIEKQMLINAIK